MTLAVTKSFAQDLSRSVRGHGSAAETGDSEDSPVTVRIEYCEPGNYRRPAEALRAAAEERFGVRAEFVPSRGGVFEISVNGRLVFSKRATRRLPATDEIFYHIRAAINARDRATS